MAMTNIMPNPMAAAAAAGRRRIQSSATTIAYTRPKEVKATAPARGMSIEAGIQGSMANAVEAMDQTTAPILICHGTNARRIQTDKIPAVKNASELKLG